MVKALVRYGDRSGNVSVTNADVLEIYKNGVATGQKITVPTLPANSIESEQVDFSISLRAHVLTSKFTATQLKTLIEAALAFEIEGDE